MKKPHDTSKDGHASPIFGIQSGSIEAMEAEGQKQMVASESLPTDTNRDDTVDDQLRVLGFTLGKPFKDDPLFRPATLPEGWKREGSDHDMWSYIVDETGKQRVSIFYKAAYYDRSAFMNLIRDRESE